MSAMQSTTPSFDELLDLVESRSAVFREAVRGGSLTARVPGCPDWSVRDLVAHLGKVQRFWGAVVAAGPAQAPPEDGSVKGREPSGDLLEWSAESTQVLLSALREAGPDRECWTWWAASGQPTTSGAVARHQVQEAAVHAFDAQEAAGRAVTLPREVALDGVAEFLQVGYGAMGGWTPWPHGPSVVGWVADEGPSWQVALAGNGGARTTPGGAQDAAATVRGPASDLVLALYGRIPLDRVRVEGDGQAVARLLAWSPAD